MLQKSKGRLNTRWVVVLLSFAVFIICLIPVPQSQLIYLSTDEFAPFAIAAHWAGLDWTSAMSTVEYYSYGYAFLLYPLVMLFKEPVLLYRAALVLNCFLAAMLVPLAYSILSRLLVEDGKTEKGPLFYAIILALALYCSTVPRANLALYEMPLIVTTTAVVAIFFHMGRDARIWHFPLLAALLVYGYMLHQRFLGIMAAGIIAFVLLLVFRRVRLVMALSFSAVFLVLILVHMPLKDYLINAVWGNGVNLSINDFSGQWGKLALVFNGELTLPLLRAVCGQLFYIGAASLVVAFAALIFLLKQVPGNFRNIRSGEKVSRSIGYTFLLIAFIFNFGISAVFMSTPVRADHIVYGRYNEILIGILVLVGLYKLFYRKTRLWEIFVCVGCFLVFVVTIRFTYGELRDAAFAPISTIGLHPYLLRDGHTGGLSLSLATACPLAGLILLWLVSKTKRVWLKSGLIALVCAFFTYVGYGTLFSTSIPTGRYFGQLTALTDVVRSDTENRPVYFVSRDKNERYISSFLQFLLYEKPLIRGTADELPTGEEYYITCPSDMLEDIGQEYVLLREAADTCLLKVNE